MGAIARKVRIVIADDEPVVRAALAQLIESEPGFELVGIAEDTDEAIALAGELQPDIALVDVRMPGGGPSAARGIRASSAQTKIVALSAYSDRETVLEMVQSGVAGYLVKGASGHEVLDTISRCARGESRLSTEITGDIVAELSQHLERTAQDEESLRGQVDRIQQVLDSPGPGMVFQAITELDSGRVVGYEALSRFEDQKPPDSWFSDAEAVGLRTELELHAAAAALEHLDHLPPSSFLTINMSPNVVGLGPYRALNSTDCSRIVLELTERAGIEDYALLGGALAEVRSLGAKIAVDDFGAGFASLGHILHLEPEFIKLDQTLTRHFDAHPLNRAMVRAMISFASESGSTIVAEGIETKEQLSTLRELGVRYGQGFYISRPGPLP